MLDVDEIDHAPIELDERLESSRRVRELAAINLDDLPDDSADVTGELLDCRRRGYTPSPSQIRAACLLIQSTWSDRERQKRIAGPSPQTWDVPIVAVSGPTLD